MYFMLFFITILIAIAAYSMILHNKVMPAQDIAYANWYKIDTLLRRRMQLIPHLLETAKGYMQHEKEVIMTLNKLRSHMRQYGLDQPNIKERIELELEFTSALEKLLEAAQQYPDLKSKIPFVNAEKRLLDLNETLNTTYTEYNAAAQDINNVLKFMPNKFIIKLFGVNKLEYFK